MTNPADASPERPETDQSLRVVSEWLRDMAEEGARPSGAGGVADPDGTYNLNVSFQRRDGTWENLRVLAVLNRLGEPVLVAKRFSHGDEPTQDAMEWEAKMLDRRKRPR